MLKLNLWIWIIWYGAMALTFRLPRKFVPLFRNFSLKTINSLLKFKYRIICQYSTVSTSEAAYIIGGVLPQKITGDIIAEFKNDSLHRFGTISKGRANHGSISIGNQFMVIGGWHYDKRLFDLKEAWLICQLGISWIAHKILYEENSTI